MRKLNIGCGLDHREGYVNIDVREEVNPDMVINLEECSLPFADGEVEEVIAHDIVEHISFRKLKPFFVELNRVMRVGGRLFIRVPDMKKLARYVLEKSWNYWEIGYWIYGGQDYPENLHKSGFTIEALDDLLSECGFAMVRCKNDDSNLIVYAEKLKNLE